MLFLVQVGLLLSGLFWASFCNKIIRNRIIISKKVQAISNQHTYKWVQEEYQVFEGKFLGVRVLP